MVFIGDGIETRNLGYFGIRKCEVCNAFRDVDLIEVKNVFRFFFFPVKTYAIKRFLCCRKCSACFEINPKLWDFYQTYMNKRLNKKDTDDIISTLTKINNEFINQGTYIDIGDSIYHGSLDTIYSTLAKKYGESEYLEELISVYFSGYRNNTENTDEKKQTN